MPSITDLRKVNTYHWPILSQIQCLSPGQPRRTLHLYPRVENVNSQLNLHYRALKYLYFLYRGAFLARQWQDSEDWKKWEIDLRNYLRPDLNLGPTDKDTRKNTQTAGVWSACTLLSQGHILCVCVDVCARRPWAVVKSIFVYHIWSSGTEDIWFIQTHTHNHKHVHSCTYK